MAKKQTISMDSRHQQAVDNKPAPKANPDHKLEEFIEEIRDRASEIFTHRGNAPGDALSDWLQAEKESRGSAG